MKAAAAIDLARASGVALMLEGEGVRYRALLTANAAILHQLRSCKAEIMELLQAERGELTTGRIITLAEMAGYRLSLADFEAPTVVAPAKRSLIIENILERHQAGIVAWLRYERDAMNRWIGRTICSRSRSKND
jgi:hypothetical protein